MLTKTIAVADTYVWLTLGRKHELSHLLFTPTQYYYYPHFRKKKTLA